MAKIDFSKMKESLSKTVDLAKEQASKIVDAAKDINVNDMKDSIVNAANEVYDKAVHFDPNQAKQDVVQMAKDTKQKMEQFNKNVKENKKRVKEIIQQKEDEEFQITVVDSLQIIYAIMKADGELSQQEQNMFENIGKQIDETFIDDKTMIETVVGSHFKNDIDNDSYVVASINSAIINSKNKKELSRLLNIKQSQFTLDNYWDVILMPIYNSLWFKDGISKPNKLESDVKRFQVAMLDSISYRY